MIGIESGADVRNDEVDRIERRASVAHRGIGDRQILADQRQRRRGRAQVGEQPLLRRDDLFQGAEVVTLPPAGPSRYGLRRHAREGSVCTLEAVGRALGVLEGGDIEERLAAVLERFVARSRQARTGHVER